MITSAPAKNAPDTNIVQKNELRPIPQAWANGILATNAISNVPIIATMIDAIYTEFHILPIATGSAPSPTNQPFAPSAATWFGFTKMIYAIAKNVVIPANISVFTELPLSEILKNLSIFALS